MMKHILQITNLSNNKNSNVIGNIIGDNSSITNNHIYINNLFDNTVKIDWSLRESNKFDDLMENKLIIKTPFKRTWTINEKMQKLIKYSNLYGYNPICRLYGCFTSLSTIQQRSDTSDLAQLELSEKDNLFNFLKSGFNIKAIISIDPNMIFSNNTYTKEQYIERCLDLHVSLKTFQNNKNLQIVFDECNTLDSVYIMDTVLLCKSFNTALDNDLKNYLVTVFDSNKDEIEKEINKFDNRFNTLKFYNEMSKKILHAESNIELFNNIYNFRMKKWFGE